MHPISRGLGCPNYARLIPKKTAKSPVWDYYGLPATDEGDIVAENLAICKICKFPISSKGGSTTNLIAHLRTYHPIEHSKVKGNRSVGSLSVSTSINIDEPRAVSTSINIDEPRAVANEISEMPPPKKQKTLLDFQPLTSTSEKQCTAAVTKFIATSMQPFSIVECLPFIEMVKTLNPRYKLPGRKYFSKNAVPKLYNDTKEKIKSELALVKSSDISLTTDFWTSINSIPFLTITAHFITSNWELKYACLCCVHFEDDHIAENISEVLKEKLAEWDLNVNHLCACTTDNGSNILKAVSFLDVQHVPCFGHSINIGINKILQIPILRKAIVKMKKLQNSISHSWKISRDFRKAQELLQMKTVKLPSACPTRWGSTLKLCKRFLENQLPLCKVLQDYPDKKYLELEKAEVSALEAFVESTALMEEITKSLSGENYATASSILPLLNKIKRKLQEKETDRPLVKEIKKDILSALEERYFKRGDLIGILRLSTVCDPRFRLNYIENEEEVKKLVLSHMVDIHQCSLNLSNNNMTNQRNEKWGLEKLLDSDDENDNEKVENDIPLPARKAENELKNYLSMPKVNLNEDPLIWWKSHEKSFPSLSILSKKYLSVQGTSVPSERVFSTGGNVISKNRSSLLPKNAEMQVFLTQNKNFI